MSGRADERSGRLNWQAILTAAAPVMDGTEEEAVTEEASSLP